MTKYVMDLEDDNVRKLIAHLRVTLGPIDRRVADQLESQIPPSRPDEPMLFGSVVMARRQDYDRRTLWVRTYAVEVDHPWTNGNQHVGWRELEDVELIAAGLERRED